MNKTTQIILTVLVVLLAGGGLLWAGFTFGQSSIYPFQANTPFRQFSADRSWNSPASPREIGDDLPCSRSFRPGMMMGKTDFSGPSAPFGRHQPGRSNFNPIQTDPLTVSETRAAVEAYLDSSDLSGLEIAEIMIFEANAYAVITEVQTGWGAFELLIDPETHTVSPEYGPNMIWNLKYGHHADESGPGMGMMRPQTRTDTSIKINEYFENAESFSMPVSAVEAAQIAQEYLDQHQPGWEVSHHQTEFYGYHTLDLEFKGEIVGMLSVNGYTGQVFPHFWHGELIEISE